MKKESTYMYAKKFCGYWRVGVLLQFVELKLECPSNCVNCDLHDPSKCKSCGNEDLTHRVLDINQACICQSGYTEVQYTYNCQDMQFNEQILQFQYILSLEEYVNRLSNRCCKQQVLSYCYNYNVNQILISIKNTSINMQNKISCLQEEFNLGLQQKQQFTYDVLEYAQLIQSQQCNFLAFDNTSTKILASFGLILKAYLFIKEELIFISLFQITKSRVTFIESLKQCNLFLFAMFNGQIQVSSSVGMNNGKYIQKLRDHRSPIYNLQSNKNSDSIISCDDWKVSFFIKQSQLQSVFSYTNNIRICAVSLNEIGDKLIISDYNKCIVALVKRETDWIKLYNFHLGKLGPGISFIGIDSFIIQEAFKTLGAKSLLDKENSKFKVMGTGVQGNSIKGILKINKYSQIKMEYQQIL
ncbi:unnamed protein product (macronuclear) [Paramecium tetraurelia]|uniref:Uncharacterized protein n=1 Tax=Paramecium tetraurelia TaxID=5888 RepID=A0BN38_PARTE|nr:uncharacterized protein GSPATT00030593001 [Paramecium tetraurelia]CAK59955.1 unnamed protein product [Paramecium tetraurelia]|eukprot:XP_001427353.1 hypothetical protein (macronuclear) [Paramecium tetraurelia strain d4-2]